MDGPLGNCLPPPRGSILARTLRKRATSARNTGAPFEFAISTTLNSFVATMIVVQDQVPRGPRYRCRHFARRHWTNLRRRTLERCRWGLFARLAARSKKAFTPVARRSLTIRVSPILDALTSAMRNDVSGPMGIPSVCRSCVSRIQVSS